MTAINEMGSKPLKKKCKIVQRTESNSSVNVYNSSNSEQCTHLPNMVHKKDKDAVDKALTKVFITNNIPLNVIDSPSFIEMVKAFSSYGFGYTLPSYSMFQTTLLRELKQDVDAYVSSVKDSWEFSRCTLMVDMWTDMKSHSFVNVAAASPKGSIFLRSFECSERRKTGACLEQLISSVIEKIGPKNVVQLITNDASNFEVAGLLIHAKFPHIYNSKCVAYEIDLFLKDIDQEVEWVAKVFRDAKMIVDYFCKHPIILDLVRRHTGGKELEKYSKTRFATHFLMLQSIIRVKDGLESMMASNEWRDMSHNKSLLGERVIQIIQDNTFWSLGSDVIAILEPLIRVLRLANNEGSTLGYLYEAVERAREVIKAGSGNVQSQSKYFKIWELFSSRRQGNLLAEVHAVAAFLNPLLMYFGKVKFDNPEVKRGFNQVTQNLIEVDQRNQFISELLVYSGRDPKVFDNVALSMMTLAHPRVWWDMCGGEIPMVQKIAIRILSQPCSSSSCTRNCSAFEVAETKQRNKFAPNMLDDSVYTRMDLKMMEIAQINEMQDRKPINLDDLVDFPEKNIDTFEEIDDMQTMNDCDNP